METQAVLFKLYRLVKKGDSYVTWKDPNFLACFFILCSVSCGEVAQNSSTLNADGKQALNCKVTNADGSKSFVLAKGEQARVSKGMGSMNFFPDGEREHLGIMLTYAMESKSSPLATKESISISIIDIKDKNNLLAATSADANSKSLTLLAPDLDLKIACTAQVE